MRLLSLLLLSLLSMSSAFATTEAYERLYRLYDIPRELTRDQVPVCFHHGCDTIARIELDDALWQRITRHFTPSAENAMAEREQIRHAIAEMEHIAGELVGTANDRAGDMKGIGTLAPQLDCIDESTNTTVYLTLFEQADLLHWHRVEPTAHRGYLFFGGWPHYTAVVSETANGQRWVIDSWFRDNGELPDVMDLKTWKDGWKPEGFFF